MHVAHLVILAESLPAMAVIITPSTPNKASLINFFFSFSITIETWSYQMLAQYSLDLQDTKRSCNLEANHYPIPNNDLLSFNSCNIT